MEPDMPATQVQPDPTFTPLDPEGQATAMHIPDTPGYAFVLPVELASSMTHTPAGRERPQAK